MKILLLLAILCSVYSCRHNKVDPKQLTTTSVVRDLPAPLKDTLVIPKKESVSAPKENDTSSQQTVVAAKEIHNVSTTSKNYHIIVASHPRLKLAEETLNKLKDKGYTGIQIISKDNRFRVSIASYSSQAEAMQQINTWKERLHRDDLWVMRN